MLLIRVNTSANHVFRTSLDGANKVNIRGPEVEAKRMHDNLFRLRPVASLISELAAELSRKYLGNGFEHIGINSWAKITQATIDYPDYHPQRVFLAQKRAMDLIEIRFQMRQRPRLQHRSESNPGELKRERYGQSKPRIISILALRSNDHWKSRLPSSTRSGKCCLVCSNCWWYSFALARFRVSSCLCCTSRRTFCKSRLVFETRPGSTYMLHT